MKSSTSAPGGGSSSSTRGSMSGIQSTATSRGRITSQLSRILRRTVAASIHASGEKSPALGVR